MLVFHKQNLVYFATPKTGSTAVESVLGPIADVAFHNPPRLKHMRPARFRNLYHNHIFGKQPARYIALMREPVDWLNSWYRYRSRDRLSGTDNSTEGLTFDQFVTAWLAETPPPMAHVGNQHRFLTGRGNDLAVDLLFDHAEIPVFTGFLSEVLGQTIVLPRKNESPVIGTDPLEPATLKALKTQHAALFDLYDRVRAASSAGSWLSRC